MQGRRVRHKVRSSSSKVYDDVECDDDDDGGIASGIVYYTYTYTSYMCGAVRLPASRHLVEWLVANRIQVQRWQFITLQLF